jgi:hypothetical protein
MTNNVVTLPIEYLISIVAGCELTGGENDTFFNGIAAFKGVEKDDIDPMRVYLMDGNAMRSAIIKKYPMFTKVENVSHDKAMLYWKEHQNETFELPKWY